MDKLKASKKTIVQALSTLFHNIHLGNFLKGKIYQGPGKRVCLPGLNCYSCPGAAGSCPIGSLQAVIGSKKYKFSFYVIGIMMFFGVVFARLICGLLCPFGFFQDILHKIPSKKFSTKKLKILRSVKYIILSAILLVIGFGLKGSYEVVPPFFCKYICPQGIVEAALPLASRNQGLRASLGPLFRMKFIILMITIILSIGFYRPFCKWICPLGAFYSLFNKFSLYQLNLDKNKCIDCGKCERVCKMDVDIRKSTHHLECIRCGDCLRACPSKAISSEFIRKNKKSEDQ